MGLKGAEMVVLGYNTPDFNIHTHEPKHLRIEHYGIITEQTGVVVSPENG